MKSSLTGTDYDELQGSQQQDCCRDDSQGRCDERPFQHRKYSACGYREGGPGIGGSAEGLTASQIGSQVKQMMDGEEVTTPGWTAGRSA